MKVAKQISMHYLFLVLFLGVIMPAASEDIDLFASGLANGAAAVSVPNVIFVLDNTSNWSRESQKWPSGTQGEAEVQAIYNTLNKLRSQSKDINVAIVEFTTLGTALENGGYVRFELQSVMDHWEELARVLGDIKDNITAPIEKRNSNSAYGNLAADIYAYLAGERQSFNGAGTPPTLAREQAYKTPFSVFRSPLTVSDVCSDTYLIFISNPDSNGPEVDSKANSGALTALYTALGESNRHALAGYAGTGLMMREFEAIKDNKNSSNSDSLGFSQACFANSNACDTEINGHPVEAAAGTVIAQNCPTGGSCFCSQVSLGAASCGQGKQFQVLKPAGGELGSYGPTANKIDGAEYNFDDWTKFLHDYGVPLKIQGEEGPADTVTRLPVTTYTIDVFNTQPSEAHSSLMDSAAQVGGGYRQEATNAAEIEQALARIFGDIVDINTSFAAVTLPLSATNRAQAENKVFVGMFRPANQRKPRWLGNLKQYQLAVFDGEVGLADVSLNRAINPQTGFAQSCATSFWTEDTSAVNKDALGGVGPYFEGLQLDPSPASECLLEFRDDRSVLSDSPDGPFVEKGGTAQKIRGQSSRRILTMDPAGGPLRPISADDFAGNTDVLEYLLGTNPGLKGGDLRVPDLSAGIVENPPYIDNPRLPEPEIAPFEGLRPTIHGDIVHSRPLILTYGEKEEGGSEFRVLYGSNDGLYRAINPEDGHEDWAFIAPEHHAAVSRLYANTPTVDYFGLDKSQSEEIGAKAKEYFFDGSTGSFTRYDDKGRLLEGYLYLTQRRGGRMIYALDVSPAEGAGIEPPAAPGFLWRAGCNGNAESTCTDAELVSIGQTWSTPVAALVRGYEGEGGSSERPNPVLLLGGGWDSCLDRDQALLNPTDCKNGKQIYALDGETGAVLRTFPTQAPVVADIEVIDFDYDGYMDFAYAADVSGRIYRITFSSITEGVIDQTVGLSPDEWVWPSSPIARSDRYGLRFMNQPIAAEVGDNIFIALGSGDRERPLKQNYPYSDENVENRFYALVDTPLTPSTSTIDLDTLLDVSAGLTASDDQGGRAQDVLQYGGWFLDMPDRGEQIVNHAAIGGGYVFFNSFQAQGSSEGFCNDLGTAKAYRVPLFSPEAVKGKVFGEGIPIPPNLVTVRLSDGGKSCTDNCGPGRITDEVVSVIIGLEGFEVVDITPSPPSKVREAFRVENIDKL
jgi:type IV pilus assembly protein PilY1